MNADKKQPVAIIIIESEHCRYHCKMTAIINGMMIRKKGEVFQTGMLYTCIPQSRFQQTKNAVERIGKRKDFSFKLMMDKGVTFKRQSKKLCGKWAVIY